MTDKDILIYG